MFAVLVATIVLVILSFIGIGIKMFLKKDGQFTRTCSTIGENGEKIGCTCENNNEETCNNRFKHHPEKYKQD